ncbi:NUDIX hydrolase [Frankia sp. CiP3]|uniref:NUDIX hydrolase n=1 Tax=Frankia sp. CiP3 TaxID=2880971 RepID=UPI001EF65A12|nr:NUDIX hydrolase [Frankia sp. CiP3]
MPDPTSAVTEDLLTHLRQRLPSSIPERARSYRPDIDTPAPTRAAATVVLLRPALSGPGGVEVCLLRRASTMAFAAGMYVFPGGTVDPADSDAEPRQFGTAGAVAPYLPGAGPALARALVCAAVRETFEESGVLLAGPDGDTIADVSGPGWESDRAALESRRTSLAAVLARRALGVRIDLLRSWARWITPEVEPRRYDTWFFVAAMPTTQLTRRIPGESDRLLWTSPAAALDDYLADRLRLMPPTAYTLGELVNYTSVEEIMAAATARDMKPIMPKISLRDGTARLVFPHDTDYGSIG